MGRPHMRGFEDDRTDGKTPYERLRGRPYQGQVAEFAEVVHLRDPGKAADMPKLDDRWSLASTTLEHRQECAGVDPSGDAQ